MNAILGLGMTIVILAAPVAASAGESTGTPVPRHDRLNDIVCRDVQQDSATRYGHRKVCMNRLDWEIRQRHDQDSLVHYQDAALMLHR